MNPFATHGMISWPELATDDPTKATDFYAAAMGWNTSIQPTPNGPYTVCKIGQPGMAGIMKKPQPQMPTAWTYYVTVDDVDAIAARVPELGGTIMFPKMVLPKVGAMIGLMDPTGAFIMAMQWDPPTEEMKSMTHPDWAERQKTEGCFSWFECQTSDPEAAVKFYTELFGWNVETQDMGTGPYHSVKVGDKGIGGICGLPSPETPPHWGGYVTTSNLDETVSKIKENGGTIPMEPFEIPSVGRIVPFQDPTGGWLIAIQYEEG